MKWLISFLADLSARLIKLAVEGATKEEIQQELLQANTALDAIDAQEDEELKKKFPNYRSKD